RVDVDAAVTVALSLHGGAMDRLVARRPDRERVPLRLARRPAGAHLDVDPRSGRRRRVPRGDELVERERRAHRGGRPGATLVGDRSAIRIGVAALRDGWAELEKLAAGHGAL